jgi:hypothetical protein
MRENIQRVAERGERLDALQDKTFVHLILPRVFPLFHCQKEVLELIGSFGNEQ